MADDITIQIQESDSITVSVNQDTDIEMSPSQSFPLVDWNTIQSKPDFDSLYYSTSNPSGYVSSGSFVTQAVLNQTGQYLLSINASTSGALRSSISILESKTGSYYSSANPSGFITGAVVRPNTYLLIDGNSLDSINWQTRQLSFEGLQSISWADRIAYDISEDPSIDWANRELVGEWVTQTDPTTNYSLVNLGFLQSYAYPTSNPSGFVTGIDSSNFVLKSQSGQFYASNNPSGYITGSVVRPTDTGSFISTSQTGAFYASNNPSGYITGVNTGVLSFAFYPLSSNPSGYVTGSVVRPSDTGAFYPRSNPSGFITGVDTSLLVLKSETGAYTGLFYPLASNPSGYLISSALSSYATQSYVNSVSGVIRTDISAIQSLTGGFVTGSVVRPSETGNFLTSGSLSSYATTGYVNTASGAIRSDISVLQTATGLLYPRTNPSGYITGINTSSFVTTGQTGSYTGAFYPLYSNPSGYITETDLNLYATEIFVTDSSGHLQGQVDDLDSQLGNFVPYNGATSNVDIGSFYFKCARLESDEFVGTAGSPAFLSYGIRVGEQGGATSNPKIIFTYNGNSAFLIAPTDLSTSQQWLIPNSGGTLATEESVAFSYYPISDNPSNYVTGLVVRPNETGDFLTSESLYNYATTGYVNSASGAIRSDISSLQNATGLLYPKTNPSGFITGFNSGNYVLASHTGTYTSLFYPLSSNPSGYATGSVVRPTDTGSFITTSQTGAFYPSSNPSGYITSSALSSYATQSYVNSASGVIRVDISALQSATGNYYLASNPSGFVTGSVVRPTETGSFVTTGFGATGYYPRSTNPSGYVTGSVIRASETGDFYPRSNPSGYTGINQYRQLAPRAIPYSTFSENVDKLLWGKATGDIPVFSTFDHATPSYIKNTSGILADVDLTCCSVWNSDYGQEKAGTAITPRHIVYAYHFPIATGSTLRFVTSDNQIVTRTLTGAVRLGVTDLLIGGLDSDLPSSIRPAAVLPSGFVSTMFHEYLNYAGIRLDKYRNLSINSVKYGANLYTSDVALRDRFYREAIVGDSGGPNFFLAGTQPVFLGPTYTPFNFTWVSTDVTGVNSILTQLGGGYSLSFIDLRPYAVSELQGTSIQINSESDGSTILNNSPSNTLFLGNEGAGTTIVAYSYTGLGMDIWSVYNTAIQANTLDSAHSIATFGLNFEKQLEITSNGSLYFTQQSNTVSSSGKLLTGESTVLDWVNLSLSQQWSHPSIATTSGHVANYHAVTGYAYPRTTNPSGYVTGSVIRPTDTGSFLTTAKITGAGTVSSYLSGSVVVLSGAAGGGGITQGQADALYYPLTGNPSGFATGSVVRPSETGSFVTSSQTGTFTGSFYPLGANPSGYVTGSVVRPSETGSFATTGIITGAGSVTVSAGGGNLIISGSSSSSSTTKLMSFVFDGGGSVLETGSKGYIRTAHAGTFYRASMLADITGSAIVDIYKNTYANYPPTVANSIAVSGKPTISNGIKMESAVFTGWTSSTFASGDVLVANLDSCSGITRLTLGLEYTT